MLLVGCLQWKIFVFLFFFDLTMKGADTSFKTNNKDSKVIWLGTSDLILSSVYTTSHQREVHLWDVRNTSAPCFEVVVDTGNNVLTPLYDYDTGILFLAGKAESTIRYGEVILDNPNVLINSIQPMDDQVKSLCMVPKLSLDLMKCEIDRLLLLTRTSVYPVPYQVPRRVHKQSYMP
jgi:coronin-7